MSTVDSPSRAASQKDDQEGHSVVGAGAEVSHLTDDDEAPERGGPSRRRSKCARTVTPKLKTSRKEYVKGKQGALQGIMKLPIEVFTEIAYYITPADLSTLVRTNKFFRAMLLSLSSTYIWRRAQSNIPELPPCPTGLSEPQYAALMFPKFCTSCGGSTPAEPDPWLCVRLCALCRETKLQDTNQGYVSGSCFVPRSLSFMYGTPVLRRSDITVYCLREEIEQVRREREEFQRKDDDEGLIEWEKERDRRLIVRNREAERLRKYMKSVAQSLARELANLKEERRQQIHDRLKALGWDEKYFVFPYGRSRQWNSLVEPEVPKPLNSLFCSPGLSRSVLVGWAKLLPQLTQLLEDNRARMADWEEQLRRIERLEKVQELICQFKRDTNPYQTIVDALGLTVQALGTSYCIQNVLGVPFPRINTVAKWDVIKDIYEEENSLEQVKELFNQRREQLDEKVRKWREEVENQLLKQYVGDGDGVEETDKFDPIVLVQGSTEATKHLSPSARFLLRADTVFVRQSWLKKSPSVDQECTQESHFLDMVFRVSDNSAFDYMLGLDEYVRHAGAEEIAKAVLKAMGMPDVAHIELSSMEDRFMCGRCYKFGPMSWKDLLAHYRYRLGHWVGGDCKANRYSTRHPVIIRNVHDLTTQPMDKPLVRILSDDECTASQDDVEIQEEEVWCLICCGVGWYAHSARDSLEPMREHMRETHDINHDLVEGLHYTKNDWLSWNESYCLAQWQKDWDAYYDTQQAGDPIEPGPQAGPSSTTETELL